MAAPDLISEGHATLALGHLSSELATRSGAWQAEAPEWFPQPPEWLDLWRLSVDATREQALADLGASDEHGPLFVVCEYREGDEGSPPEYVFVELEDRFGAGHGPDVGARWFTLEELGRDRAAESAAIEKLGGKPSDLRALGPFVRARLGGVGAGEEVERLMAVYPKVTRARLWQELEELGPELEPDEVAKRVESMIGETDEAAVIPGVKDAGDALERVFDRVFDEHVGEVYVGRAGANRADWEQSRETMREHLRAELEKAIVTGAA